MSFSGGMGPAIGPITGMRSGATRGRIGGSQSQGVNYPSPFFDVAHTYLPATLKQLLRWCRYYFLTNPLINATVFKLSEYPITDVLVDHESPETRTRWSRYLHDQLHYRSFQVEVGLDYFTYGNAFVSVSFPFTKYLTCQQCKMHKPASELVNNWIFTNYQFRLTCPKCGHTGEAAPKDVYLRNPSGIKLIRWNPEDIDIDYTDVTGEYTYYYNIPGPLRNDVVAGKKTKIVTIPQVFIQAVRTQKGVVFSKDSLFHLRRPSLATTDRGWGTPLILPVLKDTFYMQIMKKAQESILLEHILPLRVLFPQSGTGTSDPFVSLNLVDWRDQIAQEIARWRYDPAYIPILPLPVGNQSIGGDGKALMLTAEIQAWTEQIIVGLGVPREFLMGGLSFSGSNVSLRMLENSFLGYIQRHKALAHYVVRAVSAFLEWPEVSIRFKPFKMADDIQRKAFMLQLNQAQKVSDTTLLSDSDLDQEEENEIMYRESDNRIQAMKKMQLATAEIQGESQLIMMKYQAKAQQAQQQAMQAPVAPGEPGGPEEGQGQAQATQEGQAPVPQEAQSPLGAGQKLQQGQAAMDLPAVAQQWASQLAQLDPVSQQLQLANLRMQSPELAQMVESLLKKQGGGQSAAGGGGIDMRPMPEQRPPRRDNPTM
jgi:hypothetical protein